MGFLKNFFTNVLKENEQVTSTSSFQQLTEEQLEAHLRVAKYGDFLLPDAVRPSYDLQIIPTQGFRHDFYRDEESNSDVPVIMAAASKQLVFEVFMDLLEPMGNVVDVVLETSHDGGKGHEDLYREHIDMPVLKSILWEYESLLTNDGCCGIAVLNPRIPYEVQFDEHKLLIVYGNKLQPFEECLEHHAVRCDESMKFITEAEHVHSSSDAFLQQFQELKVELGMDVDYS